MNPPDAHPLVNPFRRYVRVFLVLAAVFLAVGVGSLLLLSVPIVASQPADSTARTLPLVAVLLCLPLCVSMLISALFTLPPVRRADRSFADFRDGRCLVHWTYSPEEWRAYVEQVARGGTKINWWIPAGVWLVTLAFSIAAAWNTPTLPARIALSLALPGLLLVALGGVVAGAVLMRHRRCKRLLAAVPQAYIGEQAVYCGVEFLFWGSNMRALESVTLLPGPPQTLEFIAGMSSGAKSGWRALGMALLTLGRPIPLNSLTMPLSVPVPSGAEAKAAELVRTFSTQLPQSSSRDKPVVAPNGVC